MRCLASTQITATSAGSATIHASLSRSNGTTVRVASVVTVTFVQTAHTGWLSAEPNVVASDGQSSTLLVAHVRDGANLPMPGIPVSFTCTGSQNIFASDHGVTDPNGAASF